MLYIEDYESALMLSVAFIWHQRYEMVVDPIEKIFDCVMNLKDGVCVGTCFGSIDTPKKIK